MIVVSNTSPLTNLAAIGLFRLLHELYGVVNISTAVWDELTANGERWPGANEVEVLRGTGFGSVFFRGTGLGPVRRHRAVRPLVVALLTVLSATLVLAAGCLRSPQALSGPSYLQCPEPSWVKHPRYERGFAAVGFGKSESHDFAVTKAETAARARLAAIVETHVRTLFEKLIEERRPLGEGGQTSGSELASQVLRLMSDTTLYGSRATDYYDDCVRGEVAALVVLDHGSFIRTLERTTREVLREQPVVPEAGQEAFIEALEPASKRALGLED